MTDDAWFAAVPPDETWLSAAREAIHEGHADAPADWPALAVEQGFATDEDDYYDRLRTVTVEATREAVTERATAGDRQLVHGIRSMDDCRRQANELAERVTEWGKSRDADAGTGLTFARELVANDPTDATEHRLVSLARKAVDLDDEATALREYVEQTSPEVAPNLSALAGPVLAARLISLAGGLEPLAKKPSGTLQVLGAEDALFAHLRGSAPSPKHGIIYTHEYVRGTATEHRGSAARALAGKLTIAARIDHYSGDLRPQLQMELDERIERIRSRTGDDDE